MSAYAPNDPLTMAFVFVTLVGTLLAGLALYRAPSQRYTRLLAWLLVFGATAGVEHMCRCEPAGIRMNAIIGTLLYSMKAVVSVEARAGGMPALSPGRWLAFAVLWPGMRLAPFAKLGGPVQPGAWALIAHGGKMSCLGLLALTLAKWLVWNQAQLTLHERVDYVLAMAFALSGLSLRRSGIETGWKARRNQAGKTPSSISPARKSTR